MPGGAVTAPPAPAAVGTGLSWPCCPSLQLSLARSARPCLSVACHPCQGGLRGRMHARGLELLTALMGTGCLRPGAFGPGTARGPCSSTQLSSQPPSAAGGIRSPPHGPWASRGGGEGRWRGSTRGDPPLAGQPPRRPRAALDGHVPADISVLERPALPCPHPDAEHKALSPPPRHSGHSHGSCQDPSPLARLGPPPAVSQREGRAFLQPRSSLWVLVGAPLRGGRLLP